MTDDRPDTEDRPERGRSDRDGRSERPPAVEIRDVATSYGDERVLEGVSASVDRGELVGLVGPNGAGKTTLLQTVTGALEPDDGAVLVDGDDVRALSSAAASRRIAVVPQETVPSFSFTVSEIVEMGRHPHRSRFERATLRDRAHVERAMERTGTARFADRSIDDVSGGERQRVLLARALAQDAPVLVLDEPTASLDLHHAAETMSLVRELVQDGRSAVAAIHDLELAARFCDRLLLLAEGSIVAAGPPVDVLQSDRLEAAFDTPAAVESAPVGGGVAVEPLLGDALDGREERDGRGGPTERAERVHVVGSGQPAARALGALGDAGVDCSLGPVPTGDRAAATADALGATVVEAPPFQPVPEERLGDARSLAAAADAMVLAIGERPDDERDGCPAPWRAVCEVATPVVGLEDDGTGESSGRRAVEAGTAASSGICDATAAASELPAVVAALDGAAPEESGDRSADETADDADAPLADGGQDDGSA